METLRLRYRDALDVLRQARALRVEEFDRQIATDAALATAAEADVAVELERIRLLLHEMTEWHERVERRVTEAKDRLAEEEAREFAALAELEARVVERRNVAEALSRQVLDAVARARAALSDATSLIGGVEVAPPPRPATDTGVEGVPTDGVGLPPPEAPILPATAAADAERVALWLSGSGQAGV